MSTQTDKRALIFTMSKYANMNSSELLEFLRSTRIHIKQNLIDVEDEYSSVFTSHYLSVPYEVLRALYGLSLTTDEFFKIDKSGNFFYFFYFINVYFFFYIFFPL